METTYRVGAVYDLDGEKGYTVPFRPDERALMAPDTPREHECVWGTWFLDDGTIAPGYVPLTQLTDDRLHTHPCGCTDVIALLRADGPAPRYGRQSAHFTCNIHPEA